MTTVRLYEDGEPVGYVDTETGETAYEGNDGAAALFLGEIEGGRTEVVPAEVDDDHEGLRPSTTRTVLGEELREEVVGVLEELGVDCRVEEA